MKRLTITVLVAGLFAGSLFPDFIIRGTQYEYQ